MLDILTSILSKVDADYADIRYEIKKETVISFNGRALTQLSSNSTDGYVLRVLKNGGLSSVAFTNKKGINKVIARAKENAFLISKNIDKPIRFAKSKVIVDCFLPELAEDPQQISFDEKLELTRKYNRIPLK